MATFWKDIENKYGVSTYQDTRNTYDWIMKALRIAGYNCNRIQTSFLFSISDITCSCDTIKEFTENAYGQQGYNLTQMTFRLWHKISEMVIISVENNNMVKISTESKVLLETIVNLLKSTSLEEKEHKDTIPVMLGEGKEKSPFVQFWMGVFQTIMSNFIWLLLGAIVSALIAFFL